MLVREQAALRRVATLVTREASPGEVFGGQQDNFRGTGTFLAWLVRQVPRLSGGQPVVERFSTGGALITLTCVPKPCAGGGGLVLRHEVDVLRRTNPRPRWTPVLASVRIVGRIPITHLGRVDRDYQKSRIDRQALFVPGHPSRRIDHILSIGVS